MKFKIKKIPKVLSNLEFKVKTPISLKNLSKNDKALIVTARDNFNQAPNHRILVLTMALFSAIELTVVGLSQSMENLMIQIGILIISTILFLIHQSILYKNFYEMLETKENYPMYSIFYLSSGEMRLDFYCLIWGWSFILFYPGIAVLRCFRIFRVISFFPPKSKTKNKHYNPSHHLFNPAVGAQLLMRYLKLLATELFWPEKSRGGLIILFMFFYTTYLFSLTFWKDMGVNDNKQGNSCGNIKSCFLTLVRLSVYDSVGLDYFSYINSEDEDNGIYVYSFLLVIYICFSSMVLLNALIGIFGHAFNEEDAQLESLPSDTDLFSQDGSRKALANELRAQLKMITTVLHRLDRLDRVRENNEIEEENKDIDALDYPPQASSTPPLSSALSSSLPSHIPSHIPSHSVESYSRRRSVDLSLKPVKSIKLRSIRRKLSRYSPSFFTHPLVNEVLLAKQKRSQWKSFQLFLCFTCILTILEPIIVGIFDRTMILQYCLLAASSVLIPIECILTLKAYPQVKHKTVWAKLYNIIDGELLYEIFCILWGWIFLLTGYEGLAALRCLRIFRLLWYFEMYAPGEREKSQMKMEMESELGDEVSTQSIHELKGASGRKELEIGAMTHDRVGASGEDRETYMITEETEIDKEREKESDEIVLKEEEREKEKESEKRTVESFFQSSFNTVNNNNNNTDCSDMKEIEEEVLKSSDKRIINHIIENDSNKQDTDSIVDINNTYHSHEANNNNLLPISFSPATLSRHHLSILSDAEKNIEHRISQQVSAVEAHVLAAKVEIKREIRAVDHFIHASLKVTKKCANYLRKLGSELFTAASRGGTMILGLFFYTTYLFGIMFWIEKNNLETPSGRPCVSLSKCAITMMRLSFYDSEGLNFLSAVMHEQSTTRDSRSMSGFLTTMLILYMVVTATMLLNGLIGVFSRAFEDEPEGHHSLTSSDLIQKSKQFRKDLKDMSNICCN